MKLKCDSNLFTFLLQPHRADLRVEIFAAKTVIRWKPDSEVIFFAYADRIGLKLASGAPNERSAPANVLGNSVPGATRLVRSGNLTLQLKIDADCVSTVHQFL